MRKIFLGILIISCVALSYTLYIKEKNTVYQSAIAPFYQVLGRPVLMADKVLNRAFSLAGADEKEYGESVKVKFSYLKDGSKEQLYLGSILQSLGRFQTKDFSYEIFVLDSMSPNAFAMPGGAIFVTKGLLEILDSEAELVSVVAHELGHIEKGHCFDRVKFELLAKKVGIDTLGQLADTIFSFVVLTAYNKNQEDEADEFAFSVITETEYDPMAVGFSFQRLAESHPDLEKRKDNILLEYFQTHPHTKLREEKFKERANAWWKLHSEETRYLGRKNLKERKNYYIQNYDEEWTRNKEE